MSTIHFLNVGKGDCTIIEHTSDRVTMIDICKGNYVRPPLTKNEIFEEALNELAAANGGGNFGMSKKPTNPIAYLKRINVSKLFRFILTHPDMDHMDGLDALIDFCAPQHFWETGVRRDKPEFNAAAGYLEADWDRYVKIHKNQEDGIKVLRRLAGERFQFANLNADGTGGADGLYILSPDKDIVTATTEDGDVNDGSYVILYRSPGGRILIPGDAHDETWAHVLEHYKDDVANCDVLFAPHHGRHSGADFSFLDTVKPRLTFFGCATSGHLAYEEWRKRKLEVITNNQAGNIVLESETGGIDVYVENETYAKSRGCACLKKNYLSYPLLGSLKAKPAAKAPAQL